MTPRFPGACAPGYQLPPLCGWGRFEFVRCDRVIACYNAGMSELLLEFVLYPIVDAFAWIIRLVVRSVLEIVWGLMAIVRTILGGGSSDGPGP